jgi:valyl-tRNA synthetase
MEDLRDWCISRQLWWGHQIPAWYCDDCGETIVSRQDPTACPACTGSTLRRDEDVLDTWFSSGLFPFSTMGWPERTADLAAFYPTSVLVTGFDIITFWVSRMMMFGVHFTDAEPFRDVVIHGMVRDYEGRKMSKSSGNVLDPLELVAKHGADALRLALLQAAAPGHDIPLDEQWIDAARRFGNKVWNALRFAVEHVGVSDVPETGGYPDQPGPVDAWILERLGAVTGEYDRLLDEYRFSDAVALIYNFAWAEVFDWYLEMAKTSLADPAAADATKATLGVVLRDVLKMLHPIVPFLTEDLWSHLGDGSLLITSSWPVPVTVEAPQGVEELQELVTSVRRFRSDHGLSPKQELLLMLDDPEALAAPWWRTQVTSLVNVAFEDGAPEPVAGYARIAAGTIQAFIPLEGLVDVAAERPRLEKAIAGVEAQLAKTQGKLGNAGFRDKAPAEVVAKEEAKAVELSAEIEKLRSQLAELG